MTIHITHLVQHSPVLVDQCQKLFLVNNARQSLVGLMVDELVGAKLKILRGNEE